MMEDLGEVPEMSYLVTLDVIPLNTNIPNEGGLRATWEALNGTRPGNPKPRNRSIMKLLKLGLTRNNLKFNGRFFLQIGGTTIGTNMAPDFAIVYMGDFENKYVYIHPLQPLTYLRYIDDCFMVWPHSLEELNGFILHLSDFELTLKFMYEASRSQLSFFGPPSEI